MDESMIKVNGMIAVPTQDEDFLESGDKTAEQVSPTEDVIRHGTTPLEVETPKESVREDKNIQLYVKALLVAYMNKFKGIEGKTAPKRNTPQHAIYSGILSFIGVFLVAVTDYWYLSRVFEIDDKGITMLTGAYAATAVLIYDAYQAPLAQPRNVFGAYLLCSFIGVTVRIICGFIGIPKWVTGGIALAFGIVGMNITQTLHPPGGACALIAVIGGDTIVNLGYGYILTSIGAAIIMLGVALIGNNLIPERQYPQYWY